MSDQIPEDVMKAASDLARRIYPEIDEDGWAYIAADDVEEIARALLAHERTVIERCAKIADKIGSGDGSSWFARAGKDIAASIRETAR